MRCRSHLTNCFTHISDIITISSHLYFAPAVSTCWPSGCAPRVTTEVQWPTRKRHSQHLPRWSVCSTENWWVWCHAYIFIYRFSLFLQFGEDHSQTRYSKEFLCTITKHAVMVERSLRQAGADSTEQSVEVLVVSGNHYTTAIFVSLASCVNIHVVTRFFPQCLSPTNDVLLEQLVLLMGIGSMTHR